MLIKEKSFLSLRERLADSNRIILFGAGHEGIRLLSGLKRQGFVVDVIFDNDETLYGKNIDGIEIVKPYVDENDRCTIIICVRDNEAQNAIYNQLTNIGIDSDRIVAYVLQRTDGYYSTLDEKYYKDDLMDFFFERHGYPLNWDNPKTYSEILFKERIEVKDSLRTRLVDKYLVRDWVRERIGNEHLTKLYGVWNRPEEIDFSALPDSFVLKVNNGSGKNIVVKNRSGIKEAEILNKLKEFVEKKYEYLALELQYRDVPVKITCEEYLEGVADDVYDYNIFCFHGEPKYIWCIKGSHKPECVASFYDINWEKQPFSYGYPPDPVLAPKPNKLNEMLELTRILCRDFQHVRVDWYNLPDGRVIFGEMTFSSWGGAMYFEPREYDEVFGKLVLDGMTRDI